MREMARTILRGWAAERRVKVALLGVALLGAAALGGCTEATVIGTPCKTVADCNVTGQVCAPGFNGGPNICTRKCTGQTGAMGCPIGFDCYPTDPAQGSTCNKTLYEVDPKTGAPLLIGHDCALGDVCAQLGSGNPKPSCRKIPDTSVDPPVPVEQDPNAYCTGACTNDFECPLDFRCVADYDMVKKCVKRQLCSECVVDANCPKDNPICVPTKDGTSRYCTKECAYTGDCGGTQNSALDCQPTTNAAGAAVKACLHRFGACVGSGNICDPCRTKADCMKSNSNCFENPGTKERFCSKACKSDADCTPAGTVKAVCDNTDIYNSQTNKTGMSIELCNGDVKHETPGTFSCWMPL